MCQRCSSCGWYVAGVTSFGPNECGKARQTGMYTDIVSYEPWIKKHLSGLSEEKFTCSN